jgi:hypothetical protein
MGAEAEERVAAEPPALLGRLEQEAGPPSRSFRKAETGVSVSSTNVATTRNDVPGPGKLAGLLECRDAALTLGQPSRRRAFSTWRRASMPEAAKGERDLEVVEQVGAPPRRRASSDSRAARATSLGLLPHLAPTSAGSSSSRPCRSRPGARPDGLDRPLEAGSASWATWLRRSIGGPEEAGPLTGVAGGPGRLDEGEDGVRVAVVAELADPLDVPEVAPLCQSSSGTAPELHLAGRDRPLQCLGIDPWRASAPHRSRHPG